MEDHGEWLVIDVGTPRTPGASMLIDRKDYDELVEQGLRRMYVTSYGYAIGKVGSESRLVHRLILSGVKEVDHINRDKLDNRRANLRSVEAWQNQSNRGMRKTNTSGHIGIDFHKGRWRAQLVFRGETVLCKKFVEKQDAVDAYAKAVELHRGEFAPKV
jgi:hypothetical protein